MAKRLMFKENGISDQYRWDGKKWVEANDDEIHAIWQEWIAAKGADRKYDKDGFLVYFIKD